MQELNVQLFTLINATSDTALWLVDWGRFFAWWPQLLLLVGLVILFLRKNAYGLEWLFQICVAVILTIGFNHFVSWVLPVSIPAVSDVGQLWMKGASLGSWLGDYPVFLSAVAFACLVWNRAHFFTSWVFALVLVNGWAVILIGCYFPSQVLVGTFLSMVSVGAIVVFQWGLSNLKNSIFNQELKVITVS